MSSYNQINMNTKYRFTLTHDEINQILNTLENADIPDIIWFEERLKEARQISFDKPQSYYTKEKEGISS